MPTHEYRVSVSWQGGRDGSGQIESLGGGGALPLAVPAEFGGPGGASNPEELLTSAIASCYSITFGIIATNRKLPVEEFRVQASGQVEQQGATFTFKAVVLKPTIRLAEGATDDQRSMVRDMAAKADHYCIITNTLRDKVQITVEPEIV